MITRFLIMVRQQVLGDLTLIQLLGKIKNVKASQGFLLRYNLDLRIGKLCYFGVYGIYQ